MNLAITEFLEVAHIKGTWRIDPLTRDVFLADLT
jgi:hypothetical protein